MKGKWILYALTGSWLIMLMALPSAMAQDAGTLLHTWPDSLVLETYTGTVIIDDSGTRPIYFLDVDADGISDYHLSFGPWWYSPSSGAVRPVDGAIITIVAAEWDGVLPDTLMVFELDGLLWREPVEYGQHGWNPLPIWETSSPLTTVTGVVLVDTTYYYDHYYLDVDADDVPEYKLGFGPAWYEPASGAVRPEDGQTVTIVGRIHFTSGLDVLAVFEIDGLIWREEQQPAPWGGKWVTRERGGNAYAYARNDSSSWIVFPPGNMGPDNGGGGGQGNGNYPWPDSAFVEFWQIHPDSLPGAQHMEQNRTRFMGFYINVHDPQGNGMMSGRFGQQNGRMQFLEQHQIRLQVNEQERERLHLRQDSLRVQAWNREQNAWEDVPNVAIETNSPIALVFSSSDLYSHYAIVSAPISTASEPGVELPAMYVLEQNYPNPFNPTTNIPFELPRSQHVTLIVYDMMGREVTRLVDSMVSAGSHSVVFEGSGLASGVYLYQLRGEGWMQVRRMTLSK